MMWIAVGLILAGVLIAFVSVLRGEGYLKRKVSLPPTVDNPQDSDDSQLRWKATLVTYYLDGTETRANKFRCSITLEDTTGVYRLSQDDAYGPTVAKTEASATNVVRDMIKLTILRATEPSTKIVRFD